MRGRAPEFPVNGLHVVYCVREPLFRLLRKQLPFSAAKRILIFS
jgi:hypothetical protein